MVRQAAVFLLLLLLVCSASAFYAAKDGASVEIAAGTARYVVGDTVIDITSNIDGVKFVPGETDTVSDDSVKYRTTEKFLYIIPDPEIAQEYRFDKYGLEESLTIKNRHEISYTLEMSPGAVLVPWGDNGEYKVYDPAADKDKDGYIVIRKAHGRDARGNDVAFDYKVIGNRLELVYPEKQEIAYPLYIDPVFARTYDMKLLLHMNTCENGNASIKNFIDSSRYLRVANSANNLTINTTTIGKVPKFGNGSMRNGTITSLNNLTFAGSNDFNLTGNFTLNYFHNTSATSTAPVFYYIYGNTYTWLTNFPSSSTVAFDSWVGSAHKINVTCWAGGVIPLNKWHQYTFIRNKTTMYTYMNGTLLCTNQTGVMAMNFPVDSTMNISTGPPGYLDEVSIWKDGDARVIDDFYPATEFPMYVNSSSYGGYADDNRTLSLLHLNGANNGKIFTDQTGKVWTSPTSMVVTATNQSVFDGSSGFFGDTGYLTTPENDDFDHAFDGSLYSGWTIDAWVYPTGPMVGFMYPIFGNSGDANNYLSIYNGNLRFRKNDGSYVTGATVMSNNTWHHVAAAANFGYYSGTGYNLTLFVDGNPDAIESFTDGFDYTSPSIGRVSSTYFEGWIDEFRISANPRWVSNFTVPYYPYELTNASFNISPVNPNDYTFPVSYNFNDTTPDSAWTDNTYVWEYSAAGTNQNYSRSFSTNGTKTVRFTTFNNNMSSSQTQSFVIGIPDPDFYATPTTGTAALLVTFTDATRNLTPIETYNMSFGDGSYSEDLPPWTHVYASFGTFLVNLTETTADGSAYEYKRDYIITSTEQNPPQIQSYPKYVNFHLKQGWGEPLPDVNVTMVPVNTSVGIWDWIETLTGIPIGAVPISNTTFMQNTDTYGVSSFYAIPTGKYNVEFTKAGYTIAPLVVNIQGAGDEDYYILAESPATSPYKHGVNELEAVNITLNTYIKDSSHTFINMSYNDSTGHTTGGNIFVYQKSSTPWAADTAVAIWNVTSNSCTNSTLINNAQQVTGFVQTNVTHTDFGQIKRSYPYTLKGAPVQFLGFGYDIALMVALGIMMGTVMLGGAIHARPTVIVMAFEGWIFYAIGWWQSLILRGVPETAVLLALTIVSVLGVVANFEIRKKKEKY